MLAKCVNTCYTVCWRRSCLDRGV